MNFDNNVVNEQTQNLPATQAARIASMIERVSSPIEQWNPEVGDILIGELYDRKTVQSQYGQQELFVVRDQHGRLFSYWLNKFIEQQLHAQGAKFGSIVAIEYQGKAQTSAGKSYHKYSVLVDA